LVRQTIEGSGLAFLAAMGTVMSKTLGEGETLVVDTHSVVAWEDTVELGIKKSSSGCCGCCCAGEGMFNTTLTGPGTVYFQSMSYGKFKGIITAYAIATLGMRGGAPAAAEAMAGAPAAPEQEMIAR